MVLPHLALRTPNRLVPTPRGPNHEPAMNRILSCGALALLLCSSTTSHAQQTRPTITYQGVIASNDKSALPDAVYAITVRLTSDREGRHELWRDVYQTTLHQGIFSLELG